MTRRDFEELIEEHLKEFKRKELEAPDEGPDTFQPWFILRHLPRVSKFDKVYKEIGKVRKEMDEQTKRFLAREKWLEWRIRKLEEDVKCLSEKRKKTTSATKESGKTTTAG